MSKETGGFTFENPEQGGVVIQEQSTCLDISVVRGKAPERWDDDVSRIGGGFYLTTGYAEIVARQGAEPLYFRMFRNGEVIGLALGFLTNQWMRWPGRHLFRGFQWQTHPVVVGNDPNLLDGFVRSILREVENIGVASIRLHSEDARMSPAASLEGGFTSSARLEYRVTLSHNPDEVLTRISSRKRTYLRSAIKASTLAVREIRTLDAIEKLIDFQGVSRERRRKRGEDYAVANQSAAQTIYEDYIKSGLGRMFLSYQDGTPLSGVLLHCWSGRAYYTMSGCSEQGFALNAPMITVWGAIESLCGDGYSELNMGGVGASAANPDDLAHGLYRFKRSFGGAETLCLTFEKKVPGMRSFVRDLVQR